MSKTSEYLQQMHHLFRDYRNEVQEAKRHHDEHLTADGLQARREELVQRANSAYKGKLEHLTAAMAREGREIKEAAEKALPAAPSSTRDSWERVKMLLDAGQNLARVIAKADAQNLHAIREWAPTWLDATSQGRTTDLAPFERSIAERWAAIVPDATPIREHIDSAPDIATFDQMATSLGDYLDGRYSAFGTLADAFAASFAGQQAAANLASVEPGSGAGQ